MNELIIQYWNVAWSAIVLAFLKTVIINLQDALWASISHTGRKYLPMARNQTCRLKTAGPEQRGHGFISWLSYNKSA